MRQPQLRSVGSDPPVVALTKAVHLGIVKGSSEPHPAVPRVGCFWCAQSHWAKYPARRYDQGREDSCPQRFRDLWGQRPSVVTEHTWRASKWLSHSQGQAIPPLRNAQDSVGLACPGLVWAVGYQAGHGPVSAFPVRVLCFGSFVEHLACSGLPSGAGAGAVLWESLCEVCSRACNCACFLLAGTPTP